MSKHLNLTRAQRDQVDAVAAVLKPWGLTYELQITTHLVALIAGPRGGRWRLVMPCTPRDADNAIQAARQKAQRIVREINGRLGL